MECVEAREKDFKLRNLLKNYHSSRTNKILIFVLYKKEAVELSSKIQQWGYNVTAIHGDKAQAGKPLPPFPPSSPLSLNTSLTSLPWPLGDDF